jgi:hypothetical protein
VSCPTATSCWAVGDDGTILYGTTVGQVAAPATQLLPH